MIVMNYQISNLKGMIEGPEYREKLGSIVGALYKLAFQTYSDIPRGPIKVLSKASEFFALRVSLYPTQDFTSSGRTFKMAITVDFMEE